MKENKEVECAFTMNEPNPTLNQILAATIKELRIQNKISQEDLAKLAKVDRTYISGIERGRRNITISTLERLIPPLAGDAMAFFQSLCQRIEEMDASEKHSAAIPIVQALSARAKGDK